MIKNYIETVSGIKFEFLNPKPEQFDIKDIAHALSMNCRYVGHCRNFYSVAEHSWQMARMLSDCSVEIQLAALLHDASEAYITDVASPVKQHLPDYQKMEDNIQIALFEKYGLEYPLHPAVKHADRVMLSIEAHYLLPSKGNDWGMWKQTNRPKVDPIFKPICMEPRQARINFMDKFYELTRVPW
jgi:hypothetical protein